MDYFITSILTTGYASLKNRIGLCACVNSRLINTTKVIEENTSKYR